MPKVWDDDIKLRLEEIDSILKKKYRLTHPEEECNAQRFIEMEVSHEGVRFKHHALP